MHFDAKFFEVVGWIGMVGFAICHLLLSAKKLKVNVFYQCLQLACAICLGSGAVARGYYPSAGLEIFWFTVCIASIVSYTFFKKPKKACPTCGHVLPE